MPRRYVAHAAESNVDLSRTQCKTGPLQLLGRAEKQVPSARGIARGARAWKLPADSRGTRKLRRPSSDLASALNTYSEWRWVRIY